MEQVVLVDNDGNAVGIAEKIEAHQKGWLHKAFSVLIFNSKNEILLQQRALTKYHTPGLWSNSCCSHPRPDEALEDAVHRRLQEELGFDTKVEKSLDFVYKFLDEPTQLWEHEHDTVFVGYYDGEVPFNKEEVEAVQWISFADLMAWMQRSPKEFTYWFRVFLPKVMSQLETKV